MLTDSRSRLEVLRELLSHGALSTQDELREELEARRFEVTQSTISRDLRRLGAVKTIDSQGRTVYRLSSEAVAPLSSTSLRDLVLSIVSNGSTIVIRTSPGSASLVAVHLDRLQPGGILGTIAGEDTIFVAPANLKNLNRTIEAIEKSFNQTE